MIDTSISLETLNAISKDNLAEHLGIEFIDIQPGYLKARMPVDKRTVQPLGLLNGGASAALAETTGSMAAYLSIDRKAFYCLGLEMKINHVKPLAKGYVYATAEAVHIGKLTHVWQIRNTDETGELVSLVTLTMAVLPADQQTNLLFGGKLSALM